MSIAARRIQRSAPADCCGIIVESHKADMNARGCYVAPGQAIDEHGTITGTPPAALTLSFWVSGLASPFVSFGERAAEWLGAVASGDQGQIQAVINTSFGELYAPGGGEAPEWTEVAEKRRRSPYRRGDVALPQRRLARRRKGDMLSLRRAYHAPCGVQDQPDRAQTD